MADEAGVTGDTKPKLKKAVPGQGNSGCKNRQDKQGNPANPWVWVLKVRYGRKGERGRAVFFSAVHPPILQEENPRQ